jgi:transcriptional regulator with GAF, ATPase, and Fis domain
LCTEEQDGSRSNERTIQCTESKFQELIEWLDRNEILRQYGVRRTGKLAILATEEMSGEIVALPIRRPIDGWKKGVHGALLVELESGRTIREDQHVLLESFASPAWLLLATFENTSSQKQKPSTAQDETKAKSLESLVGAESGLRTVMERVELVAPADMPVLILGDTGTGKEVVARAIHQRSARAERPFIRVNCGAIPSELIDSQLFGHEKGSFTGASDQRRGWF